MQNDKVLYDRDGFKCVMFSIDDESHEEKFLSVNQYLIVNNGEGFLIDPGCSAAFDDVLEAVERHMRPENLKYISFSHQDPDVAGSLAEWVSYSSAKLIFPAIWSRFMEHYGLMDSSRVLLVPDEGMAFEFNDKTLHFIPAHFLHSPGQFTIYDETSKVLFSADIGAAVLPVQEANKPIDDFDSYSEYLLSFHQRFMAANIFCKAWISRVSKFDVQIIAPQHGTLLTNEMVKQFLDWFSELKCGADLLGKNDT